MRLSQKETWKRGIWLALIVRVFLFKNETLESGAPSGNDYVINSASTDDSGVYICEAQYDTGLSTRTFVTVYVNGT